MQNLTPYVHEWEESGTLPNDLWTRVADAGILMPTGAGASIPQGWGRKYPIMGDVPAEEWDGFHDFILHDEFGRVGGIGCDNPVLFLLLLRSLALLTFRGAKVSSAVCWGAW